MCLCVYGNNSGNCLHFTWQYCVRGLAGGNFLQPTWLGTLISQLSHVRMKPKTMDNLAIWNGLGSCVYNVYCSDRTSSIITIVLHSFGIKILMTKPHVEGN